MKDLRKFCILIAEMREAQKACLNPQTRTQSAITKVRELERRVDAVLLQELNTLPQQGQILRVEAA